MQLFGLVNALLASERPTARVNLSIQRYAIMPLSNNSGLIGWVPNCDTMHQLIKRYRESKASVSRCVSAAAVRGVCAARLLCLLRATNAPCGSWSFITAGLTPSVFSHRACINSVRQNGHVLRKVPIDLSGHTDAPVICHRQRRVAT